MVEKHHASNAIVLSYAANAFCVYVSIDLLIQKVLSSLRENDMYENEGIEALQHFRYIQELLNAYKNCNPFTCFVHRKNASVT